MISNITACNAGIWGVCVSIMRYLANMLSREVLYEWKCRSVRQGISDGSNDSVNRSIAIWYSDRVGLCSSCWLAVS